MQPIGSYHTAYRHCVSYIVRNSRVSNSVAMFRDKRSEGMYTVIVTWTFLETAGSISVPDVRIWFILVRLYVVNHFTRTSVHTDSVVIEMTTRLQLKPLHSRNSEQTITSSNLHSSIQRHLYLICGLPL